jgi:GT2 family glycosyltransferase
MQGIESIQDQRQGRDWPKVSIIVLNWEGWRDTIECLESIRNAQYPSLKTVVIDNASTDDSWERLTGWAVQEEKQYCEQAFSIHSASRLPMQLVNDRDSMPQEKGGIPVIMECISTLSGRFLLIRTTLNLGYAGGNNVGLRILRSDPSIEYVILANNDIVICPGAIHTLIKCMQNQKNVGATGPRVVYAQSGTTAHGAGFIDWIRSSTTSMDSDQSIQCDYVTGAFAVFSRRALDSQGWLINDSYFLYWEDTDLCMRLKRLGYKIVYVPKAVVKHKVSRSSGRMNRSEPSTYFYFRGRVMFILRFSNGWHRMWFLVGVLPLFYLSRLGTNLLGIALGRRKIGAICALTHALLDGLTDHRKWEPFWRSRLGGS